MANYTVRLKDSKFGRVLLASLSDDNVADAKTDAVSTPPVSSPGGAYVAGQVVDQSAVLKVSGLDVNGNQITPYTQLPVIPARVKTPVG